jgi:cytoskeletal protein CcmA (bactofilin family)
VLRPYKVEGQIRIKGRSKVKGRVRIKKVKGRVRIKKVKGRVRIKGKSENNGDVDRAAYEKRVCRMAFWTYMRFSD